MGLLMCAKAVSVLDDKAAANQNPQAGNGSGISCVCASQNCKALPRGCHGGIV
jgi:hypothetical protein